MTNLVTKTDIDMLLTEAFTLNTVEGLKELVGTHSKDFNEYHVTFTYGKVVQGVREVIICIKDRSRSILGGMLKQDYHLKAVQGKDRLLTDLTWG